MLAIATTRVSILRGTTTDGYLDVVDNGTVAASGIPASLLEQTRSSTRRADRRPQTVRSYACRLPASTDIHPDDRIRDERTGLVYAQDNSLHNDGVVIGTDIKLLLRLVT
jgi:hypothetical protein